MELYSPINDEEKRLSYKADIEKIPLGGVMELLPLCNMDCRMCYVRMSKAEMDAQGTMLTCDEWLHIAEQAREAGTLFLTITGGEPLLYPEFKRLYSTLRSRGFILRVNTNGTMINEEWADFFAEHGCREISISMYGPDDETYEALCRNPRGFTQVMRAAKLLKERNVTFRFTCSLTPYNLVHLERIQHVADEMGIPLSAASYMYPAARRGEEGIKHQERLTPEEAAQALLRIYQTRNPDKQVADAAQKTIELIKEVPRLRASSTCFPCHAGHSAYWMNWKGEMAPCGMFDCPAISMKEHSFAECWSHIVSETAAMPRCKTCNNCPVQNICQICPAMNYTETGRFDGWPEYKCRMTKELVRLCMEHIEKPQK